MSSPSYTLPTNIIFCPRSGLPLAKVEALCSHGWPLINTLQSATHGLLHPIYGMPLDKLLIKLRSELHHAEQIAWCSIDNEMREIQLSVSAVMYALDCIWLPPAEATHLWNKLEPSLPAWFVCVASAKRLLHLASWYHYATSKRLSFPLYRISKTNNNLNWENFSAWLDDAYEVKSQWEKGRDALKDAEELKLRTEALITVKAENIYKRIDFNKVWGWIDIQMKQDARYPEGRRQTFKSIFMSGDMHPEEWSLDDVEDVQMAVLETCDAGNEIMFFIRKRLSHIHRMIQDFYSSFTLLNTVSKEAQGLLDNVTQHEVQTTAAFFQKFDRRIEALGSLPPEPKRESFESNAKFIQAQAQWRILKRRYEQTQGASNSGNSILSSI